MPIITPSRTDVHVNKPLTNISVAYIQDETSFVAGRVFPLVPVAKQSDVFFIYNKEDFFRDEMRKRAPGTESAGGTYGLSTDKYYADVYAYHRDIPEQLRANADSPIDLDRESTLFITHKALIRREKDWADTFFTSTSTWSNNITGHASSTGTNQVIQWNSDSSDPIQDIRSASLNMLKTTGFEPNKLVLGAKTYNTLLDHPDIIARIDRGQTSGLAKTAMVTMEDVFEIDEIFVMKSIMADGAGTTSFIGSEDKALLLYVPPSPGIMTPSAGYTFAWTGFLGAEEGGLRVKRFYMDHIESERIEIDMAYALKKVSADLGCLFTSIVG